jgi:cell wall-associated NlpC family hydrolase
VKQKRRLLFVVGLTVTMSLASVCGQEQKETFGDKLKKLFSHPTPTPTPRRSHRRSSPVPSSEASAPAVPSYGETPVAKPEPSASVETMSPVQAETPEWQNFEPVRAMSPGPHSRTELIRAPQTMPAPTGTPTPPPEIASEATTEERPAPSLPAMFAPATTSTPKVAKEEIPKEKPEPSPQETIPIPNAESKGSLEKIPNAQSPTPVFTFTRPPAPAVLEKTKAPTPSTKEMPAPAISVEGISESSAYSPEVKKIIDVGLDLTTRNLAYKYASADPANGGLDCSGFIYYVLTKSGVKSVPRDAREQYIWVRKSGNFQAVLAHSDDTFELDSLKPGDLLFWANNSGVSREPEISQTMIYIGRDKSTKQRLIIGASEGGSFKGAKKSGVAVFDFKLRTAESKPDEESTSVFVGYGPIPSSSGD